MKLFTMLFALLLAVPYFAFAAADKTKPTLSSFSVSDSPITEGDTVTIKYKVKDSGGLKKVELWKGVSKSNLGPIKTDSVSGTSDEGKFTDKPSAGTFWYGIHVIDKSGNVGYDNGAKSVEVKKRDTTKPTVSISVDHGSINLGDTVNIKYTVMDSGGSGLNKVELWRGTDKNNLGPTGQTKSLSGKGDGPVMDTFSDKPSSAVTYYYGIHAIDGAGNVGYDNGAQQVTVKAPVQTNTNSSKIIDDVMKKVNTRDYVGGQCTDSGQDTWCYAFARQFYGLPRVNDANQAFFELQKNSAYINKIKSESNFNNIPIGSLVFWGGGKYGHAAIKVDGSSVVGEGNPPILNNDKCIVTKVNYTNITSKNMPLLGYFNP